MKRAMTMELDLPPATPAQATLCEEFGDWCDRHGFARQAGDSPMLLNLLDRRQRAWLSNFIARWDWSTEFNARQPCALRTPLELAGMFMTVLRENSSRGEFECVLAGAWLPADYMDIASLMTLAFARLHGVPVDGPRALDQRQVEERLKAAAAILVDEFVRAFAKAQPCP